MADVLDDLLDAVMKVEMSQKAVALLMDRMAGIEANLAAGCSEKIQVLALISAFIQARGLMFGDDETTGMESD